MFTNETDKRLCLTADGRVVEEGDPDAVQVLVGPGGQIPLEVAEKHGLTKKAAKAAETKAVEKPPATKGK